MPLMMLQHKLQTTRECGSRIPKKYRSSGRVPRAAGFLSGTTTMIRWPLLQQPHGRLICIS